MRKRHIPADALILDYQWDEWIGSFRWAPKRFARPRSMLGRLGKLGFETILQLKPAVNLPAATTQELGQKRFTLTRRDGSVHTCNFHQGRSAYLDFFQPGTCRWYERQLGRLLADGVGGWWTDEGDWLGFEAQTVRDLERAASGIRNLYNNAWCRALYEGQRRRSRRRVVNLSRAGSAGIQALAASIWSGDVRSTWEGLASQLQMGLNTGMSGVPFWTTDGGGFFGRPSRELYVRWAQFAVFSPLTRFHGCTPREPWHFGPQAEKLVRAVLQWRMQLMPYVYATAWQAHTDGLPMMRAMALEYPADPRFANLASQYFFGDSLLVRPITTRAADIRRQGGRVRTELGPGRWYDFWTGRDVTPSSAGRSSRGSQPPVRVEASVRLDRIPVYVRGPSVIVLAAPADNTRRQSWTRLTVRLYLGDMADGWETRFDLYEDDGETYAYEKGAYRLTTIRGRRQAPRSASLTFQPQGRRPAHPARQRRWDLELFGVASCPRIRVGPTVVGVTSDGECWRTRLPAIGVTQPMRLTIAW
jgi:alpha-glucosidase (family GH31 glycosyl hydrolase)